MDVPLDLIVIDINGGLEDPVGDEAITREKSRRSIPMKAFLDGLRSPGAWSRDPMAVDFGSFMSSLTRTFSSNLANPQYVGQNLAVISQPMPTSTCAWAIIST